jgi:hypothetical protein
LFLTTLEKSSTLRSVRGIFTLGEAAGVSAAS